MVSVTSSLRPVENKYFDFFPNLKMISNFGVGLNHLDLEYLKNRGIDVAHTPTDVHVADMAMGLLISVTRQIAFLDKYVRSKKWTKLTPDIITNSVTGKKIGIYGLGRIGKKIAQRAQGFDMEIGYFGRKRQEKEPYRHFNSLNDLALWCDFLVVSAPATQETENSIDESILNDLGAKGYLINVARGNIVDEPALIKALKNNAIAGAGLDVYLNEPHISSEFIELENVVLTPHTAGFTHENIHVFANLIAYIEAEELITPAKYQS